MNRCKSCGETENYNFVINNGLCDPCIEGLLENMQDDNVEKEARIVELEEWYDSLMEYCVDGYYKCEKCGGPVREGLVCAWCDDVAPSEPAAAEKEAE